MQDPVLVVHIGGAKVRDVAGSSGDGERHVAIRRWPRPGPLPGADLVVAHGGTALLVGWARARRHRVTLRYWRTAPCDAGAVVAWVVGVATLDASTAHPLSAPVVPGRPMDLDDRVRVFPAATRPAGDDLLVAGPGPDRHLMELTGTGPRAWQSLASGAALADVVSELVEATGAPRPEAEADVLRFATSLVAAGLAERA